MFGFVNGVDKAILLPLRDSSADVSSVSPSSERRFTLAKGGLQIVLLRLSLNKCRLIQKVSQL